MNWSSLPEPTLLQRAFLFGITGILLGTISLLNTQLRLLDAPMGPLNGVSLLLQFFAIGLAILVLKKKKVATEYKEKSQLMLLILTVALLFFIFSL
jgi:membrane-associated HD superfamily phosphohydrolase